MESALIGSFISAMATVLGAAPIFFIRKLSEKWKDILIAFTAGIMVVIPPDDGLIEPWNYGGKIK